MLKGVDGIETIEKRNLEEISGKCEELKSTPLCVNNEHKPHSLGAQGP